MGLFCVSKGALDLFECPGCGATAVYRLDDKYRRLFAGWLRGAPKCEKFRYKIWCSNCAVQKPYIAEDPPF